MKPNLDAVPKWVRTVAVVAGVLLSVDALAGTFMQRAIGPISWVQAANQTHQKVDQHDQVLDRLDKAIEGINGRFCKEALRKCIAERSAAGEDPIACVDEVHCEDGTP